jgi:hypothetical protein
MNRSLITGAAIALGYFLMTASPVHGDWVHDLVASKFAHDKGKIYVPAPNPARGTLWDRRLAAELSRHGWGHGCGCGRKSSVVFKDRSEPREHAGEHEYDGEDWTPDWLGDHEQRGEK